MAKKCGEGDIDSEVLKEPGAEMCAFVRLVITACCPSTTLTPLEALAEPGSSDVVPNLKGYNIDTLATAISASTESPSLTVKTSACKCFHLASSRNCNTSNNLPHLVEYISGLEFRSSPKTVSGRRLSND
jgi:hypothetical protein